MELTWLCVGVIDKVTQKYPFPISVSIMHWNTILCKASLMRKQYFRRSLLQP